MSHYFADDAVGVVSFTYSGFKEQLSPLCGYATHAMLHWSQDAADEKLFMPQSGELPIGEGCEAHGHVLIVLTEHYEMEEWDEWLDLIKKGHIKPSKYFETAALYAVA